MTTRRTTDELLLFAVVRIRVKQRALRSRHVSRLWWTVGVVVRVIGVGLVAFRLVVSNVIVSNVIGHTGAGARSQPATNGASADGRHYWRRDSGSKRCNARQNFGQLALLNPQLRCGLEITKRESPPISGAALAIPLGRF